MSNQPNVGQFCWNELATPNIKAAKEFYANAFGWKFTDHQMEHMTYSMVTCGDKEFAGFWEIPNDQQQAIPPHWMSYILVDDIEARLALVKKLGATVKMPVTKAGTFGQFAIIIDPTGAHVALWESMES